MRAKPGFALAVLFLVNVLNFYDRQVLGAVLEPLRREFSLSDTQSGAMVTLFTIVFAVAGWPLGRMADTRSRRRLLAGGVSLWAVLTALTGLAANYAMLLATRLGVGIGEAVCAPAATSWIGDITPPQRRSRALAFFMMAVPVGSMLAAAVGGPVAQAYGWRMAMAVAAAPAVLLAPLLLWLREPPRGASVPSDAHNPSRARKQAIAAAPLKLPPAFWWIAASGALVNFILYTFATFLPSFLTRVHGLSVARAGVWTGIGSGVTGIAGALVSAAVGDRVKNRLRVAGLACGLAALPFVLGLQMPVGRAGVAIALTMAGYGLLQLYYGLVYAAIQDRVGPECRGRAMALYFVVMYLCGASWGPVVTGRLSDFLARGSGLGGEAARAAGLHGAMYIIPVLAMALGAVLWRAGGIRNTA